MSQSHPPRTSARRSPARLAKPAILAVAAAAFAILAGISLAAPTASANPHVVAAVPTLSNPTGDGDMNVMFNCASYPANKQMTRGQALVRGQSWLDERPPYNQAGCHSNQYGSYRTDCSGFVSMAWGAKESYATSNISAISHPIPRADLQPGDALNKPGSHMALFVRWADAAHTQPWVMEHGGPGAPHQGAWSAAWASGFTPIRYNNIVEDAQPQPPLHVLTVAGGNLFSNARWSDGVWNGANLADTNGPIVDVATAGMPNLDLQILTVVGGKLYSNARWADGTWNGPRLVDGYGSGTITDVAVAAMPNGDLQVLTLDGGKLYSNARWANGTWNGPRLVDGYGSATVTDVAAAATPNGDLQVLTLDGGKLYSNARWANGTWNGPSHVGSSGINITRVAAAGMPGGDLQVLTVEGGHVYSNARWANGTWNGQAYVGGTGTITEIAAADMPNGDLQVLTLDSGKVYSDARWANGTWNGARLLDSNGSITDLAAAS
jgi:hypothetical protein